MERFREEEMSEAMWEGLFEKERREAARRERFEAELAAEKVAMAAARAEAVEAFVAFGCGDEEDADRMLLRTIEAFIFDAGEE
jgi:23S rRNA C2498 (ribose-2'-O)-methylase RlmM